MSNGYLAFYYPNQKETGSAFQFSIWKRKNGSPAVRLEAAKQNAPKPSAGTSTSCFDWSKEAKAAMQIDAGECGKLGAYIRGFNRDDKFAKLFHTSETREGVKATATLQLKAPTKGDARNPNQNWMLSFERKMGDQVFKATAYIHAGEIYQLLWLLDLTICGEMRHAAQSKEARIGSQAANQGA